MFPTQGSDPCLPHHRQILYHWAVWGVPKTLDCLLKTKHERWKPMPVKMETLPRYLKTATEHPSDVSLLKNSNPTPPTPVSCYLRKNQAFFRASQGDSVVKNLPSKQETWVWSLGQKDSLEEEMATHFNILGNPMDRGVWWATGHGLAKASDTTEQLKQQTPTRAFFQTLSEKSGEDSQKRIKLIWASVGNKHLQSYSPHWVGRSAEAKWREGREWEAGGAQNQHLASLPPWACVQCWATGKEQKYLVFLNKQTS